MQTNDQMTVRRVTSENQAAPGVFRAYCQHLLAAGIPASEHGYYIRWLKLYLAACRQQGWPLGDLRHLNAFLIQIQNHASTGFLKVQAARAVKIYAAHAPSTVKKVTPSKPPVSLPQPASPAQPALTVKKPGMPAAARVEPRLQQQRQQALLQARRVCQAKTAMAPETPAAAAVDQAPRTAQAAWDRVYHQLTAEIKLRHYSPRTLKLYRNWLRRFAHFMQHKPPDRLSSKDVRDFLSDLATTHGVAASTQNQAFNALLFVFEHVLKTRFVVQDAVRAKHKPYIPTVLSRAEIDQVLAELAAPYDLVVKLLYGCGLRLAECLNLRVQDLDFELYQLTVRRGKGQKDRVVPLPHCLRGALQDQLQQVKQLLKADLSDATAGVFLPGLLAKKYRQAHRQFSWQWLFPAFKLTWVPELQAHRRYHLHETHVQKAIHSAVQAAMISKRASAHTFRHSYASHLLQANVDIRTIQHLLGHSDVRTTLIYLHTLPAESRRPACSPLDL